MVLDRCRREIRFGQYGLLWGGIQEKFTTEQKISIENDKEKDEVIFRSKEAVMIATAAVQQTKERELDLQCKVDSMLREIENFTNERQSLRRFW